MNNNKIIEENKKLYALIERWCNLLKNDGKNTKKTVREEMKQFIEQNKDEKIK